VTKRSKLKTVAVLSQTAIALLTGAILMALSIGARAQADGITNGHVQLAYGGHDFDRETNAFPSSSVTSSSATNFFVCGRGRYRDPRTGRCIGPSDIGD
jgi:hypothetical protein